MTRQNISSGSPWEARVGYSRAVRVGNIVEVAGTVAADSKGRVVGKDDAYAQTRYILGKIEAALAQAGATLHDVVRTRVFLTDIDDWEAVSRAHGEVFARIKPASTMLEVSRLVSADFCVEIEASAHITP